LTSTLQEKQKTILTNSIEKAKAPVFLSGSELNFPEIIYIYDNLVDIYSRMKPPLYYDKDMDHTKVREREK
jgi:hypothetical protein